MSDIDWDALRNRKGASRMADIPPVVLRALNAGRLETVTLTEWLAIDPVALMHAAVGDVDAPALADPLIEAARSLADAGITQRMRGLGAAWHEALATVPQTRARERIRKRLATHTSDMIRAWAAYSHTADPSLDLEERLTLARPFAADGAMSVRECAWDSFRPYLAPELDRALTLLEAWVHDADPNIRRCAVECTRPRGVWTKHIDALKDDPELARALLDPLRADESRYVQNAVANWLNDASKSQPDWTRSVCRSWTESSDSSATGYIVRRALRTLRKQAAE